MCGKLIIKIGGNMIEDMRAVWNDPSKATGAHTIYVKNAEQFYELFSPKRLELLRHLVLSGGKESVSEVASKLGRKQEAVSRDAALLEGFNMIEKTKRKKQVYLKAPHATLVVDLASA